MLTLKFLTLAHRSYYSIFFSALLLHFKFMVFFRFFSTFTSILPFFSSKIFNFYCALTYVKGKILASVFRDFSAFNFFFSKLGVIFSNNLKIFFDLLFFLNENFKNITFLTFLFFSKFLNFFNLDLFIFSRIFLSPVRFRFFFPPYLFILLLSYNQKKIFK